MGEAWRALGDYGVDIVPIFSVHGPPFPPPLPLLRAAGFAGCVSSLRLPVVQAARLRSGRGAGLRPRAAAGPTLIRPEGDVPIRGGDPPAAFGHREEGAARSAPPRASGCRRLPRAFPARQCRNGRRHCARARSVAPAPPAGEPARRPQHHAHAKPSPTCRDGRHPAPRPARRSQRPAPARLDRFQWKNIPFQRIW